MHELNLATAERLIDFSGKNEEYTALKKPQLEGAVALYNMLSKHQLAYLGDEVGMGKTYIALGVVALMRYFDPELRVLFLSPKLNIRDKWQKDYKSFIENNYCQNDLRVKALDHQSAVPSVICRNISDLLQAATCGSYADFFICTSAMSISLGSKKEQLDNKLNELRSLFPGFNMPELTDVDKESVKNIWAQAINQALPTFDLVIVDEAHNLKAGIDSSDRNRVLSQIMGVSLDPATHNLTPRAKNVLLLSATPYDRDPKQLQNQLALFNKVDLLPDEKLGDVKETLKSFMVRRINTLYFGSKDHSRNMYRKEYRCSGKAVVPMNDKQKLFAALVQKRVTEVLNEDFSGKFQTGMLASFESYIPENKDKNEEFDGQNEGEEKKTPDQNIIRELVQSYKARFNHAPPHPKMDHVAKQLATEMFSDGRKQLVFVRRVKSVSELKNKLEEHYDSWIIKYMTQHCPTLPFQEIFDTYIAETRKNINCNITEAEIDSHNPDEKVPPSNDNFFTWFFRGESNDLIKQWKAKNNLKAPDDLRSPLVIKSSSTYYWFELNWANFLSETPPPTKAIYDIHTDLCSENNGSKISDFEQVQYAYFCWLEGRGNDSQKRFASTLKSFYFPSTPMCSKLDVEKVEKLLHKNTFFNALAAELASDIFPHWQTLKTLYHEGIVKETEQQLKHDIKRLHIHKEILFALIRIDHLLIDAYLVFCEHPDLKDESFITKFVERLKQQKAIKAGFSSYKILSGLADQLDLIIKVNFSDIYHKSLSEIRKHIVSQIAPFSPVIGATGQNSSNRSPQARRFRMPGYPMALVSTDVFQEGEDLHTFCDSVTHYGLSGNPISIEQKVGRVDRIASLAHRNLLASKTDPSQYFIQVNYPFIRESIEYLQVQQLAHNLNAFLTSLHEENPANDEEVDIQQSSMNNDPHIQPQITSLLESPYNPSIPEHASQDFLSDIDTCQSELNNKLEKIKEKIQSVHKDLVIGINASLDETEKTLHLRSMRGYPELILSLHRNTSEAFDVSKNNQTLISNLKELGEEWQVRYFIDDAKSLYRHAEMYIGDCDSVFQTEEICDIRSRVFASSTNLCSYSRVSDCEWQQLLKNMSTQPLAELPNFINKEDLSVKVDISSQSIAFLFNKLQRRHTTYWREENGYIHFTSKAISSAEVKLLAEQQPHLLINYTLRRNQHHDLVDAHIDKNNQLCMRIVHPQKHLQSSEFMLAAYLVASAANRVKFLITGSDSDITMDFNNSADYATDRRLVAT